MTGAGGVGAYAPMLTLLFGVTPSTVISRRLGSGSCDATDRPRRRPSQGPVNHGLVGWIVLVSVPMAFLGAQLFRVMSHTKATQSNIEIALGVALFIGAAGLILRLLSTVAMGRRAPRGCPRLDGSASGDGGHRDGRWAHRRGDLSGFGLAHDRPAPSILQASPRGGDRCPLDNPEGPPDDRDIAAACGKGSRVSR